MEKTTKLFAFDLDGTFLKSDLTIAPSTLKAIKLIKQNGDIAAIATGRHLSTSRYIIEQTGIEFFIGTNGGKIVDIQNNEKLIYEKFISEEISQTLLKYIVEHGAGFALYTRKMIYIYKIKVGESDLENLTSNIYIEGKEAKYIKEIHDISREEWNDIFKNTYKIILITTEAKKGGFMDELDIIFGAHVSYFPGSHGTIEINPKGINKWTGLNKLNQHIKQIKKINATTTYAFGDNYNDWDMIENADVGVAMENAELPIKDIANITTDTNNNDGIYKAIVKIYEN